MKRLIDLRYHACQRFVGLRVGPWRVALLTAPSLWWLRPGRLWYWFGVPGGSPILHVGPLTIYWWGTW